MENSSCVEIERCMSDMTGGCNWRSHTNFHADPTSFYASTLYIPTSSYVQHYAFVEMGATNTHFFILKIKLMIADGWCCYIILLIIIIYRNTLSIFQKSLIYCIITLLGTKLR